MSARIIDGNAIAKQKRDIIQADIKLNGLTPKLAIILANRLDASTIYVRRKMKICKEMGIEAILHEIDDNKTTDDVIALIQTLNDDESIHGVFIQLPTHKGLNSDKIIQTINPAKDVDGLTFINMGKLMAGDKTGLSACTP